MSLHPPAAFPDDPPEYEGADHALVMLTNDHHRRAMDAQCRYCAEPWPCTTAILTRWVRLLRANGKEAP